MLSQELRPASWEEVAGQKENIDLLKAIVRNPEEAPKSLIFSGEYGTGKCVIKGTRILTSVGYIPIDSLVVRNRFNKEGFRDISDKHIKVDGKHEISHLYKEPNPIETVIIQGRNFCLEGTKKHPVLVYLDGKKQWIKLGDMQTGYKIILPSKTPDLNKEKFQDIKDFTETDKGILLGYLSSECVVEESKIKVNLPNKAIKRLLSFLRNHSMEESVTYEVVTEAKTDSKKEKKHRVYSDVMINDSELSEIVKTFYDGTDLEYFYRLNKDFILGFISGAIQHEEVQSAVYDLIYDLGRMVGIYFPTKRHSVHSMLNGNVSMESTLFESLSKNSYEKIKELYKGIPRDYLYPDEETESDSDLSCYELSAVTNIKKSFGEVYDVTVPESHVFLAGGLVNHNTTSARILAKELNGIKDRDYDILNSPYLYEFDSTIIGNVDNIRKLREEFSFSYGDYWKVITLDEFHCISTMAQNALLKMLEENTGKNIFVLATTEVNKILPTIRSRSLELHFDKVPYEDIVDNLKTVCKRKNIEITEQVISLIADRSGGHMRNAHMLLDKYLLLGEEAFKKSVLSAVSLYCDYLTAIHKGNKEEILNTLNLLLSIPKNNLEMDWNTVITECMRAYSGFPVKHKVVLGVVKEWGRDFNYVISCYMAKWFRNVFVDMPYFQCTFLNLYITLTNVLKKNRATRIETRQEISSLKPIR